MQQWNMLLMPFPVFWRFQDIGLSEDEAKDIALASNTTTPVDSRSKVNARGDYKFIKQYLAQLEQKEDRKFRLNKLANSTISSPSLG